MTDTYKVLPLRRENGKKLTVKPWGNKVVVTVWQKNGAPKLALIFDPDEAAALRQALGHAIEEATNG